MLKKMMLLAMAVGALVAFAVPASASAQPMFLHEGEPIAEGGETETFRGHVEFTGGITCAEAHATVHITTNDASIDGFEVSGCVTTGTLAAIGCSVNTVTPTITAGTGNGWPVDINSESDLSITGPSIDNTLNGCALPAVNVTGGTVTATVNGGEGGPINHLTLSGNVTTTLGEAPVHGTLTADHHGTYEIVE
jgi:hypothetical protein